MNLVEIVEGSARAYPDRLALRFEDQCLTYAELDQTCSRAANGLERVGLQRGDRAAIWLPNSVAFVVAYLGVQKVGAVAVTVNTAFKAEELQHILADSGARLLITTAALYAGLGGAALAQVEQVLLVDGEQEGLLAFAALLEHSSSVYGCAEMAPDDPAILLYTSGTTGFPRGAVLSHGAAVTAVQMVVDGLGLCVEDRVLLPLSLFHSFGQAAAFLPTLAVGATLFLLSHFEPQPVLAAIEEQAVTVFFGVPTVYLVLLGQAVPARLRSVRRWLSAGAALPLAVASEWQARCGLPIQEGYGLTEIFLATFNSEPLAKPGSVGRPLAGVCLQIVDAAGDAAGEAAGEAVSAGQLGEVVVQTPSCMLGYWQRPHESAAVLRGGSFHTGDVGWLDEDGYLYIVDRIKDMINVGGVKVYPSEVEQRLYQHPAVAEAAVFGVPEPVLGEQVQASVVLKAEAAVDAQELIFFCSQGLAEFKVPSQIHIVDRLPKNRTGKLLKRLLRDQYMQEGQQGMQQGMQQGTSLRQQLDQLRGEERDLRVKAHVQELALKLLGTVPGDDEKFLAFGLDSLMSIQLANRLSMSLGIALPSTLAFTYETLGRLVHYLIERLADGVPAEKSRSMLSSAAPLTDWVPQLYNQRECYLWHEAAANKACLHIPQCVYIHSPVESRRLERALQALVERHMALRTVYMRQGGDLLQRTLPAQRVDFAAVVLEEQPWSSVVEAILADARAPFDLTQGPVLRGRLYSRTDDDHLFLLVVHHIAADATALSVLVSELWKIYGALGEGGEPVLPAIRADWADFVRWQDALLQGAEGERLWRYWQHQLRGELPQLALPTDLPRPVQDSHAGRPYVFALEEKLTESLRQLAQRENCTLYMVLMAGFQLWLHGYTLQRDLLVAAHVANRNDLMFADVVGYLADTFPIRAQIPAGATFQSVLHQVQQTILAAMEHQGLPMRLLAERLGVAVEPSQTVLCQVWFTLLPLRLFQENGELFQVGAGSIERGGLVLEAADLLPAWLGAWYDLEMILTEGESVVFGTLVYKTDLFVESTVRQMIAEYCALLERIVAEPGWAVAELAVVAV